MDGTDPFYTRSVISSSSFSSTRSVVSSSSFSSTRSVVSSSSFSSTDSFSFRYEDSSIYTSTTNTSSSGGICSVNLEIYSNPKIYVYAYSEICAATNNFFLKPLSSSKDVWLCSIRKKDVVVIQRKLRHKVDMSQIEDRLSTICKSYHFSVIQLLGASISGDRIFLVYDYVSGENLADFLRNPKISKPFVLSSWDMRMNIAKEIAHGLEHIHHYVESEMSIVHNHLKSTSVIITFLFLTVKICHFGTAELSGEIFGEQIGESEIERRRCYMAPELITGGTPSQKSDVFAFGVLLLEILSGDEPKVIYDEESGDYGKISLIDSARGAIESTDKTKIRQWIDKRLHRSYTDKAEKMMRVGLECVHVEPNKRPDMRCVALKIEKVISLRE